MERLKELIQSEDSDLWDYKEELITLINEAIARQSATSEAVREAIEFQEKYAKSCQESIEQLERGDVNYIKSRMDDGKWTNNCINDDIIAKEKREIFLHNIAITALQAYQPWVPVSERLPDQCESYLVVVKEKDQPHDLIHVDVASSYGEYIDDFWDTFNDWKEGQEVHVTHWKPLPEPPKGE